LQQQAAAAADSALAAAAVAAAAAAAAAAATSVAADSSFSSDTSHAMKPYIWNNRLGPSRSRLEGEVEEGRWHYGWFLPWTPGGTMDDFIYGRHRGRETKGSCLGPAWTCWHMQTKNSGIENLQNNINHGNVLLHGIMLVKEKCLQLEDKVKALGTCNLMQMKKTSVLKLTKQQHESWQHMSCRLPQACTFGLVCPCLCQYLIQKLFMNASFNRKIHAGTRKRKNEIKVHNSIILEWKLWSFCRFRVENRQCNHKIVVQTSNQQVLSLGKNLLPGQAATYFWEYFYLMATMECWELKSS
jgi:hypothetical protein